MSEQRRHNYVKCPDCGIYTVCTDCDEYEVQIEALEAVQIAEREKVRRAVVDAMKEILRQNQDPDALYIDGLSIADKAVDAICGPEGVR